LPILFKIISEIIPLVPQINSTSPDLRSCQGPKKYTGKTALQEMKAEVNTDDLSRVPAPKVGKMPKAAGKQPKKRAGYQVA